MIYNHFIALHKRYYRLWGKYLNCAKLQAHIAQLRKRKEFWQSVGSQAVQDICQRIDQAYQLFFKHHKKGVRPPGFKKVGLNNLVALTSNQPGFIPLLINGRPLESINQFYNQRKAQLQSQLK